MIKKIIKTEIIEEYIKTNNLSKSAFCKKCNIAPSTLKCIIENNANVGIVALFKIARILDIHINELFVC